MKFNFDKSFNLSIEFEGTEKIQILSEFKKINEKTAPIFNWFNNTEIPQSEKDKYNDQCIKALVEMRWAYNLLQRCGVTEKEISEWSALPF